MTVKRTWVVENTWICTSCKAQNLGRFMECQTCRNPKEADEEDIVPDANKAPEVTDRDLLGLANQGANWVCEYCGGQVRNEFGKCVKNCGAPKPGTPEPHPPKRKSGVHIESSDGRMKISVSGGSRVSNIHFDGKQVLDDQGRVLGEDGTPVSSVAPTRAARKWLEPVLWVLGGGVAIGGVVWLCVFLFSSHEETANVSEIQWRYEQNLYQRVTLHEEGWGTRMGAFNVSCQQRQRGTRDCHPHQCRPHTVYRDCNCVQEECNCHKSCTSNKNGFSTCSEECDRCSKCDRCSETQYDTCYEQCPVYKDWCSYDYYDWNREATLVTSGVAHDEHWGALKAEGSLQRLDQSATYTVGFVRGQEHWTYAPRSLEEFRYFNTGVTWHILVNRVGTVKPIQASR